MIVCCGVYTIEIKEFTGLHIGDAVARAACNNQSETSIADACTAVRSVERGGGRGKVFPGPATFGGPAVAQKY